MSKSNSMAIRTEREQELLNRLVELFHDNGDVMPDRRQIDKCSLINTGEVLAILGKKRGWDGVFAELRAELERLGLQISTQKSKKHKKHPRVFPPLEPAKATVLSEPESMPDSETKKRGRKPQAFTFEGEMAKLFQYRDLLDGAYPTPSNLPNLSRKYPELHITSAATLEKRLGRSYKEWPSLMKEYEEDQKLVEKTE